MPSSTPLGENRLLQRTTCADLTRLKPHLTKIRMATGKVLHPAGTPIEHVYFPLGGMVSLLAVMKSGEQIETAITGREGVVGASVGIDGAFSNGQATVQADGPAWQITSARFLDVYNTSASFRSLMNRYLGVRRSRAPPATPSTRWNRDCAAGCCRRRTWWRATWSI